VFVTRKAGPAAEVEAVDPHQLFRSLAGRSGLVLAVSGGPDSTALMVLIAQWRERPPTLVVSVDHGVRFESAEEARIAAENADRLDLRARIVKAPPRPQTGNLQDWARRVRYRSLADVAIEMGYDTIVTAHHRDDQAETFLLRLARGSGVYGLAAMADESSYEDLLLARPLLGLSRETLATIAAASGLPISADPGNTDPRFDRARLRGFMPVLAEHGLTSERLAETAGRLRRAATAHDHYALRFIRERFAINSFGVATGDARAVADEPEEVALRALALLVRSVGGAEYTPRLDSVEALREAALAADAGESTKRTLGGVVFAAQGRNITIQREWGREGLAEVTTEPGSEVVWDRRFRCIIPLLPGRLQVGPLGRAERRLQASAETSVIRTLPGLFQNGTLVAVPDGIPAADDGPNITRFATTCLVSDRLGLAQEDGEPPA
jgi:tRNA(Ile)-lysidine synthase